MATTIRNKLLSNAQKALEKGNLTRAIKHYNKLLDLNPDDVRVRLRIGDLQARLGKRRDAIETYEQVAEEYYYQGFYLKSVAVLKQILRLDPTRTDIQVKLAELYQQLNLVSDGMAQYRAVAETFRERGDTERNLEVLARIAEIEPDDINTHLTMGEQLSQLGRVDEAADAFAKASDRLYQSGRLSEFVKVTERYLFHRGDDLGRLKRLIEVYLERSDAKRALAKLQLLFKSDPKDIEGLSLLANAFLAIDKPAKAAKVLNELADVYTAEGQEELAIETYRRVVEIDPANSEACTHLGIAPTVAPQATEQFIPVEPLTGETKVPNNVVVANASVMSDRPNEWRRLRPASGLYQMATGLTTCSEGLRPELEEEINRLLVEIDGYAKVGLNDHAYATVQQALGIDPNNITVRERSAQLALRTGSVNKAIDSLLALAKLCWKSDPVRATSYLHHAIRIDPENTEAAALREDLGLANADLEAFMLERSESELDIVEVEEEANGAEPVGQPARFDADVSAPSTGTSFDRKETVVSDSPYELLGQAAAWTAPLSGADGVTVDSGPSEKVEVDLTATGPPIVAPATAATSELPPQTTGAPAGSKPKDDWVPFAPVDVDSSQEGLLVSDDTTDAISRAAAELERQLALQDSPLLGSPAEQTGAQVIVLEDYEDEDLDDLFLDPDDDDEPEQIAPETGAEEPSEDEDDRPATAPLSVPLLVDPPKSVQQPSMMTGLEIGSELAAVLDELSRSVEGDEPEEASSPVPLSDPVTPTPSSMLQPVENLRRSVQVDLPLKPAEPAFPVDDEPEPLLANADNASPGAVEAPPQRADEGLEPLEKRMESVLAELEGVSGLRRAPGSGPVLTVQTPPVGNSPDPAATEQRADASPTGSPVTPDKAAVKTADDNGQPPKLDLPALPAGLPKGLSDDINELEFYSTAGLHDEAQTLLFEITANFPGHAELVMDRMEEIRVQLAVRELTS